MEHEMTEQYTMEINALTQKKRYRQINRVLIWQADASPWETAGFWPIAATTALDPQTEM